ncbi:MAG: hypothetical protein IPJ84_06775 [Bdellovibrionales bacterium]|nr:hypothetical protein [Bdellovibrionales bacterium]
MSAFRLASEWARGIRLRTKAVSSTGSTNDDAKNATDPLMALHGPGDAVLYLADQQTHGRGRNQNQWQALPGQALLSSWTFAIDKTTPLQPVFSPLAGLALHDAVHAAWPGLKLAIKPPNDLHIIVGTNQTQTAMKVAGLLIEVVSDSSKPFHTVVVGLGFNLSGSPEGTAPYPATSIAAASVAQGLPFAESHLFLFMNAFRQGLNSALAQATENSLNKEMCRKIQSAIACHPDFSDVTSISAKGDLIRKGGETSWSEL